MSSSISPNMGLVVPGVGTEPGPAWANEINSDLGILDQHNHSNGQGVQITPAGININTDFPINGNNLTSVNTVRFNNLVGTIAGSAPNLGIVYEAVNELYFNDGVGNIVQITKNGSINATSSGISSGTASASFSGGVLIVDSNTNTPGNIQAGSILLGNNVMASNFATLQPPNALASDYTVTLIPNNSSGSTVFMTYDTSNNMGLGPSTTAGITGSNIAAQTITQGLLAPRSLGSTVGAGGVAISSSCGAFSTSSGSATPITNLSVTITTTGRPVQIMIQSDNSGANNYSGFSVTNTGIFIALGQFNIFNGANSISAANFGAQNASGSGFTTYAPGGILNCLDTTVNGSAGTYTYIVKASASNATVTAGDLVLVAYEI